MSTVALAATMLPAAQAQPQQTPAPQHLSALDFDLTRTWTLLMSTTMLSLMLALSVVSYSMGALLL